MQYLIVFLMFLEELVDHPLLLIEVSCLLKFQINLILFILDFPKDFKSDVLSVEQFITP
jgi:hypothetical protein